MSAAIALFVFGAATAVLSLSLPLGTLRLPGSGFFPLALGVALMGLAATQGWLLHREKPVEKPAEKPAAAPSDGATRRVVLFMAVVAATTALLSTLGYLATSFLLMVGLLRVLGVRWDHSALIAAASALGCYVVFVRWLRIPMPTGMLGF
jgi:hypothetical protein